MVERGQLVRHTRSGFSGFVTQIHEEKVDEDIFGGTIYAPNGIVRVYVLDSGYSGIRPGTILDMGEVALEPTTRVDVERRRDGIAYLTNNGNDDGLYVPCSRYGRNTRECAPVAWRLAYITSRETGEGITTDDLDHAMGLVVNDHDDVAYMVREYGHGMYR